MPLPSGFKTKQEYASYMREYRKRQVNLPYWAGIVDGEGTIVIRKTKPYGKQKAPLYRLTVRITNTYYPLLEQARNQFGGGCIVLHKDDRPNRKPVYSWHIESRKAYTFLRKIYRYLIIKSHQASLAIAFQSSIGKPCGLHGLDDKTIQKRERYFQLMKKLNQ